MKDRWTQLAVSEQSSKPEWNSTEMGGLSDYQGMYNYSVTSSFALRKKIIGLSFWHVWIFITVEVIQQTIKKTL